MGYRYYLGIINKKDLEDVNQLTFEDEYDKFDAYKNRCRYVFELGKLWSINSDVIYEKIQETKQDLLKEEECYICSQQIFLELANVYRIIVMNNFKETYDKLKSIDLDHLTKEQKTEITELIMECRSKWGHLQNAEFKDKLHLTDFYEHEMFALMHLHLTTDFENEVIICFAY